MALDAHTADLLATARQTLLKELLPALPKSQHYACLMAANAIAISLRVNQAGDAALRARAALLAESGQTVPAPDALSLDQILAGERALADALRRDAHGRDDDAIADSLLRQIKARLQVTNPKLAASR